jgi:hypothetical protein
MAATRSAGSDGANADWGSDRTACACGAARPRRPKGCVGFTLMGRNLRGKGLPESCSNTAETGRLAYARRNIADAGNMHLLQIVLFEHRIYLNTGAHFWVRCARARGDSRFNRIRRGADVMPSVRILPHLVHAAAMSEGVDSGNRFGKPLFATIAPHFHRESLGTIAARSLRQRPRKAGNTRAEPQSGKGEVPYGAH